MEPERAQALLTQLYTVASRAREMEALCTVLAHESDAIEQYASVLHLSMHRTTVAMHVLAELLSAGKAEGDGHGEDR